MRDLRRWAARLALLAIAALVLPGGSSCDGNLGSGGTGAVSFRVSVAPNFTPANGQSTYPSASRDGNLVAFSSRAGNLAPSPTSFREVFVRNRATQSVVNASRLAFVPDPSGAADCDRPMISADGLWVVFESKGDLGGETLATGPEATSVIYRKDLDPFNVANPPVPIVIGPSSVPAVWPDADCVNASVSEDGRVITFESRATDLATTVPYTNPGNRLGVFVVDFRPSPAVIRLVSHTDGDTSTLATGSSNNARVSADGNWIVFESTATDLLPTPTSGIRKIYRAATDGSSMELISRLDGVAGAEATAVCVSPSVSRDGSIISFLTTGGNLQTLPDGLGEPVMVRDLTDALNPVTRQLASDAFIFFFAADRTWMSDDGRSFVYTGIRDNPPDMVITVADSSGGGTFAVSKGVVTNASTLQEFPQVALSGDGRWVFWWADYASEVFNDTNDIGDVFGFGPLR